jgi:hypothetical protein
MLQAKVPLHIQYQELQQLYVRIVQLQNTSTEIGKMVNLHVIQADFLEDPQGRTFVDVVNDPEQPFDKVLEFFGDANRQRRMEESELHHDRSPLAGVVRELESQPAIDRFLAGVSTRRKTRFAQAIGVLGLDHKSAKC